MNKYFVFLILCCTLILGLFVYFNYAKIENVTKIKSENWDFHLKNALNTPTVLNNCLYVCDELGNAFKISQLPNGKHIYNQYKNNLSDCAFESPCAQNEDMWFVSDNSGVIYASQADSLIWTFKANANIKAPMVFYNGILYVGSYDQNLYAIEAHSGILKWQYTTNGFINASVAISPRNNALFFGNCDGILRKINLKTGKLIAEVNLENPLPSAPIMHDEKLYICTYQGELFCIEPATLETLWVKRLKGAFSQELTSFEKEVCLVDEQGALFILDKDDGTILKEEKHPYKLLPPLIINNQYLFFNKYGKYSYGSQKGNIEGIFSKPLIHYQDGFICVDEEGGIFYRSLHLTTNEEVKK